MKSNLQKVITFFLLMLFVSFTAIRAEDLKRIMSLSGIWKFTIGDDVQWSGTSYDDSDWDQINVPDTWEGQGYNDYNGYAWYRKTFQVSSIPENSPVYMMLGRIDDADVVYLNGKILGRSGSFPPNQVTAYSKTRKYNIPKGFLNENGENIIAVRVYDSQQDGGILDGPIGIYYDADTELLSLNLTGRWKIHAGDNKEWRSADFDDKDWKRVQVPGEWENEVLPEYDGYAWYRVNFKVPQNFMTGDLYLTLGKIDDEDDVYLNGKYIGSVHDLKKDGDYRRSGWEFNARRIYKIDGSLLKRGESNNIAIRVYDGQGAGGIYQGPVGFMSPENYRRYRNKHYSNQSFWDFVFDAMFID